MACETITIDNVMAGFKEQKGKIEPIVEGAWHPDVLRDLYHRAVGGSLRR